MTNINSLNYTKHLPYICYLLCRFKMISFVISSDVSILIFEPFSRISTKSNRGVAFLSLIPNKTILFTIFYSWSPNTNGFFSISSDMQSLMTPSLAPACTNANSGTMTIYVPSCDTSCITRSTYLSSIK